MTRCGRCGRVIVEGEAVVAIKVSTTTIDKKDLNVTMRVESDENVHARCPWPPPPDPFDDYPKKPGRGWLVWACEALGLAITGTAVDLVARLAAVGFDGMEAPGEPMRCGPPSMDVAKDGDF